MASVGSFSSSRQRARHTADETEGSAACSVRAVLRASALRPAESNAPTNSRMSANLCWGNLCEVSACECGKGGILAQMHEPC